MDKTKAEEFVRSIRFNDLGLLPVVVQDFATRDVLMMAYMNDEALRLTLVGPHVWYFSRSRNKLWKKGETSGHLQTVRDIRVDCDRDTLLVLVDQISAACHNGYRSCFYRSISDNGETVNASRLLDPSEVYSKS